jgi:hypothetical protein
MIRTPLPSHHELLTTTAVSSSIVVFGVGQSRRIAGLSRDELTSETAMVSRSVRRGNIPRAGPRYPIGQARI